jgi:hypothetical protein
MLELFAPRRIQIPDLGPCVSQSCRWPLRRCGTPRPRFRARVRKLTIEQVAAIRPLAETQTLRTLDAEFGVSHETIRTTLRAAGAADVGDGIAAG